MRVGSKVRLTMAMGVLSRRGALVRDGIIEKIDGGDIYVSLPALKVDGKPVVVHRYASEMEEYQ